LSTAWNSAPRSRLGSGVAGARAPRRAARGVGGHGGAAGGTAVRSCRSARRRKSRCKPATAKFGCLGFSGSQQFWNPNFVGQSEAACWTAAPGWAEVAAEKFGIHARPQARLRTRRRASPRPQPVRSPLGSRRDREVGHAFCTVTQEGMPPRSPLLPRQDPRPPSRKELRPRVDSPSFLVFPSGHLARNWGAASPSDRLRGGAASHLPRRRDCHWKAHDWSPTRERDRARPTEHPASSNVPECKRALTL